MRSHHIWEQAVNDDDDLRTSSRDAAFATSHYVVLSGDRPALEGNRLSPTTTSTTQDPSLLLEAGSHHYSNNNQKTTNDTGSDVTPEKETDFTIVSFSGAIVENRLFQKIIIILIVINSILMGIGTYGFVTNHPAVNRTFDQLDAAFLCLFTAELGLQFVHHGVLGLFQDSWLTFDFCVIALSWAFSSLQVIRAFRIVRAARLITKISELKDLILALGKAMTKLFAIAVLMVLVFYVFGVMFTQLFQTAYADGVTDIDYFSTLHQTLFTLFQLMTLDSWSAITRELMTVYPWAWLPLFCFVMVSSFIVINLVIAVICDAVAGMQHEEQEVVIKRMESIVEHHHAVLPGPVTTTMTPPLEIARLEAKIDHLTHLVHTLMQQRQHPYHQPVAEQPPLPPIS